MERYTSEVTELFLLMLAFFMLSFFGAIMFGGVS